ncbi:4'-phosphopantetheinyl transferase superfamily protein [Streptomyces sp. NPDC051985]|uniref:4'-phosphopantetheinyl transferase family protein n=1 Tax=Streptomyces sp. NPDC051985 TaxID=3155807 RepID=UPI003428214B
MTNHNEDKAPTLHSTRHTTGATRPPTERNAPALADQDAPVSVERAARASAERADGIAVERGVRVSAERDDRVFVGRGVRVPVERADGMPAEQGVRVSVERDAWVSVERGARVSAERDAPVSAERADGIPVERDDRVFVGRGVRVPVERADGMPAERGVRVAAERDGRIPVDLWLVRSPGPVGGGRRLAVAELDGRERSRAAGFLRPRDGLLYTAAHIALRRLLAAVLGVSPQDVAYVRELCPGCGAPHGRPAVRPGPEPAPHFSLSHSGGCALVAVAPAPVGVDIQRRPTERATEVCVGLLHPGERAELEALPRDRRAAALGQLWARKEAYLKGIGTGLERPAHADYLGTPGHGPWRRPPHWTVLDLSRAPAHAAVAVPGVPALPLRIRPLPAEWLHEGDAAPALAGIAHLTRAVRVKETTT